MKDTLFQLLHEARLAEIASLAAQKKRVLSLLTALSYDPHPLIAWRAVEAFGLAAARVAQTDAEYVRNHLRRLFWLVNDESGGIVWRAPELIGETLHRCPGPFAEFASPLIYLLDMEAEDALRFRPGVLWAVARIAPHLASGVLPPPPDRQPGIPWQSLVLECLSAPDAQSRGMALWCLKSLGDAQPLPLYADLLADERPVEIYLDGRLIETSVSSLAARMSLNW
jgi:hypothetical protein